MFYKFLGGNYLVVPLVEGLNTINEQKTIRYITLWLCGVTSDIKSSVLTAVANTSYNSCSIATITQNNSAYVCTFIANMCEISVSMRRKTVLRRV